MNDFVINYHFTNTRRIKVDINIGYNQDILKAKQVLETIRILKLLPEYMGYILPTKAKCAWDTSCIIVAGADDADMALAVNRIHQLKGGIVICENNEITCELALPVFGIISELPVDKITWHMEKIKTAAKKLGVDFPDPLLTLITLTGAAIPYLRICEEGLVNLKDGKTLGLFVKD